MSATRMAKRHPKLQPGNKLTTQDEVVGFAQHLASNEPFCLAVWDTLVTIEKREQQLAKEKALLAEIERRKKLSPVRRFLEKTWREF